MTDEQIERRLEALTDALEARFKPPMTQAEYDAESAKIMKWAERQWSLPEHLRSP